MPALSCPGDGRGTVGKMEEELSNPRRQQLLPHPPALEGSRLSPLPLPLATCSQGTALKAWQGRRQEAF